MVWADHQVPIPEPSKGRGQKCTSKYQKDVVQSRDTWNGLEWQEHSIHGQHGEVRL